MRRAVNGCCSLLTVGSGYNTPVRQTVDLGELVRTLRLSLESSALGSRSEDDIKFEDDIMSNVLASTYLEQARVEMVEVVTLMDKRQKYKMNYFRHPLRGDDGFDPSTDRVSFLTILCACYIAPINPLKPPFMPFFCLYRRSTLHVNERRSGDTFRHRRSVGYQRGSLTQGDPGFCWPKG